MIAIDQWNVISSNRESCGLIGELFGRFNQTRVMFGGTLVEASSSFRAPLDATSDADSETHAERLPLYSTDELCAVVTAMQEIGQLPSATTGKFVCLLFCRFLRLLC